MNIAGYGFLQRTLSLPVFPVDPPAQIAPVQRILQAADGSIQVPRSVAPASDHPLDHVLFALKHEGLNLQVLSEALPRIPAAEIRARFIEKPSSAYIRQACFLWEAFTKETLEDLPAVSGSYSDLFDPARYVTGASERHPKWRVAFNGLGSLQYCPIVRRTQDVEQLLSKRILERTQGFLDSIGLEAAERAMGWAYLSETESSFAIERETPGTNKKAAFVALLQQAHNARPLTETYLSDLQSATITNPFDRAACFRHEQNWLRQGGLRGAAGISYVPPTPESLGRLMPDFLEMANALPRQVDPLVAAAVSSFGFVFLHPFMDGNGRLSRFLFHDALCRSGELQDGMVLPVSIAMKRHEMAYLKALKSFSTPARALWSVSWIDEDQFTFDFKGSEAIYRFWDATPCVEFGLRMAEEALAVDLVQEVEFLAKFDLIRRALDEQFDLRSNDQHLLILSALQNNGIISKHRRKQLAGRVPDEVFAFIESAVLEESEAEPAKTARIRPR